MKKALALILCLCMVLAMCACGKTGAPASGAPASEAPASEAPTSEALAGKIDFEPQTVKLAHVAAEDSGLNQALLEFARLVNERTNGDITIDVSAGGILGTEPELKEMLSVGTIQMTSMGWSLLTNKLSYSIAYFGYYLMLDRDELNAFYDSETAQLFYDAYEKATGVRVIGHSFYQAARDLMANKPLENLNDLKGFKIRTPNGVAVDIESWSAWNCSPVPMALSEVYTALEQGVVDGVECPCSYLSNYGFADAGAKYLMISEHQIYNNLLGVNAEWFDSLPAEYQEIIIEAEKEAGELCKKLEMEQEQAYIDKMVNEQGVTVIEWSDEFKQQLKEMVAPVYEENMKLAIEEANALLG